MVKKNTLIISYLHKHHYNTRSNLKAHAGGDRFKIASSAEKAFSQ
nr:hypothetical protein [Pedobacter kyonggii]